MISQRTHLAIITMTAIAVFACIARGEGFRFSPMNHGHCAGHCAALDPTDAQRAAIETRFERYLSDWRDVDEANGAVHNWLMGFQPGLFEMDSQILAIDVSRRIDAGNVAWHRAIRSLEDSYFDDLAVMPGIDSAIVQRLRFERRRTWVFKAAADQSWYQPPIVLCDLAGALTEAGIDPHETPERITVMNAYQRTLDEIVTRLDDGQLAMREASREHSKIASDGWKSGDMNLRRNGLAGLIEVSRFAFPISKELHALNSQTMQRLEPLLSPQQFVRLSAASLPRMYPELFADEGDRAAFRRLAEALAGSALSTGERGRLETIYAEWTTRAQRLLPQVTAMRDVQEGEVRRALMNGYLESTKHEPDPQSEAVASRLERFDRDLQAWRDAMKGWSKRVAEVLDE